MYVDIGIPESSIYNCSKPLHIDAAAEVSIKRANQDSTSRVVIISHALFYRFSLPLPKWLVISPAG